MLTILGNRWNDHRQTVLRLAVALMVVAAVAWLAYQFWRLLWASEPIWPTSPTGGFDLMLRQNEVGLWFSSMPFYGVVPTALYPPASYAILWPLIGWLVFAPARWFWAATSVVALVWLIYLIVKESGADTPLERVFVALIPVSMYATGATIGNGQMGIHVLALLLAGVLLACRGQGRFWQDLLAAILFSLSLVKPTIAAPFYWIVLFVPGRLRPAFLVLCVYGLLTLLAVSFQKADPVSLMAGWLGGGSKVGSFEGPADPHILLGKAGLAGLSRAVTLFMVLLLGLWTYLHRRVDLWLLLGVAALVARFWTYHQWYDDALILLPMVALFRIAKGSASKDKGGVVAGILLAISIAAMLAPGGLFLFPMPWNRAFATGQWLLWSGVLVFLLYQAWRSRGMQDSI